jgi:hypothetical protein
MIDPVSASTAAEIGWVHWLPIATTVVAVVLLVELARRFLARPSALHRLWWALGVLCYGSGTALESAITLRGNSAALNKAWFVAGAVLGAWPLAQGTVYLLVRRPLAHRLTAVTAAFAAVLSFLVLLSPTDLAALEPHRPGGGALGWQWLRLLTPLLNVYAALVLVGGAAWSAAGYLRRGDSRARALGNSLIALGALLPAVGGAMAKGGAVEALYVAELVGLLCIGAGDRVCRAP